MNGKGKSSALDYRAVWERLTSELRACKEGEHQTWGNVESATWGRYLAGELPTEERDALEEQLKQFPELANFVGLVRMVLTKCESREDPTNDEGKQGDSQHGDAIAL